MAGGPVVGPGHKFFNGHRFRFRAYLRRQRFDGRLELDVFGRS